MFKIKKLKANYGSDAILKGISMDVKRGEIVGIVGPNGCGKSTILKSIFGLTKVTQGDIVFEGSSILNTPTSLVIKKGITYVSQNRSIFHKLSVLENLEMGGYIMKDEKKLREKIVEIIEDFPFIKRNINTCAYYLSGGQQQLLAIAMALVVEPKLLLMDEPSLGLSPENMSKVFEKICSIRTSGISFLIVEQNVKQIRSIADTLYTVQDGLILSRVSLATSGKFKSV